MIYSSSRYRAMEEYAASYTYNRRRDWQWMVHDRNMLRPGHFEVMWSTHLRGINNVKHRWQRRSSWPKAKKVAMLRII